MEVLSGNFCLHQIVQNFVTCSCWSEQRMGDVGQQTEYLGDTIIFVALTDTRVLNFFLSK